MKLVYFGTKFEAMWRFSLSTTSLGHAFEPLFVGYIDSCLDKNNDFYVWPRLVAYKIYV